MVFKQLRRQGEGQLNFNNIQYKGIRLDPDKNNYFRYHETLITEIKDHKDRFRKIRNKELMEKYKYVRDYQMSYNPAFWQEVNAIPMKPYLKVAHDQLGKEIDLEAQFVKNSGRLRKLIKFLNNLLHSFF